MDIFINASAAVVGLGFIFGLAAVIFASFGRKKDAAEAPKESAGEEKRAAVVCCTGIDQVCERKLDYQGPASCAAAAAIFQGPLTCPAACLGGGDCVPACPSRAIVLRNGLAMVKKELCDGCGACLGSCPRGLIKLLPAGTAYAACSLKGADRGEDVICGAGCDGCGLCAVICPKGAIRTEGKLPIIDETLCDGCGLCLKSCPRNIIHILSDDVLKEV